MSQKAEEKTEKFLEEYKRLEAALRNTEDRSAVSVLEYEDILNRENRSDDADRLKTCRIIRNYIQHHADGKAIFPASSAMTEFVSALADSIENEGADVADIMAKQKAVKLMDDPSVIATTLSKAKDGWAAAVDADNIPVGIITAKAFLKCTGKGAEPSTDVLMRDADSKAAWKRAEMVPASAKARDYADRNGRICIVTGKTGKYKGVLV